MYFAKNLKMTHAVEGGGGSHVLLFLWFWRIAYKNRCVTYPLHLNTFETIEKTEPDNYD